MRFRSESVNVRSSPLRVNSKKDRSPEESKEMIKSPNMLSEEGIIASYKSPLFMANLMVFKKDQQYKQARS